MGSVGMNKNGSYFVSKFLGSMCRTHYHFYRNTLTNVKSVATPGPGNYRLPSDFGYYEAKKKDPNQARTPGPGMGSRSASQPALDKATK